MRREVTAWSAWALAVSVLLHGALLAWIAWREPRPTLPRASPPIEVAIFEVPKPVPDRPPEPEPEAKPAAKPAPPEPKPIARPATPRPQRVTPPPVTAVEPEPEPRPTPEPPSTDAPLARADAPTVDGPRAAPTLLPGLEITTKLEPGGGDFAVRQEPPKGLRAPEVPKDLARSIALETVGKGKVERGLVHPYYRELGRTLLKRWDADRAVSQHGLRGYAEQAVERGRQWNKIWMEHAEQFGGSGNPLGGEDTDRPREAVPVAAAVDPNLAARQELKKQMRKEFRATRKATLRVVQDAQGKLVSVELVSPSHDAAVDKEAMVDVRAAAEQLPPPPPEALGNRTELASLWQFELIISISPPVPSVSFEFDEALGFVDPRLPLDRRIYKRVKLLAVE